MEELMLEVEVPYAGPNAELWAQNSLKNDTKYDRCVQPRIDEFIKRHEGKNLALFRIEEPVEVRVDDSWHATTIHRYYYV